MRIKDLFTVPSGERVMERHLRRVLVSSVCSILLCMSMLVGTTWAWFTVSVENTGNVIEIAQSSMSVEFQTHDGTVTPDNAGGYILSPGTYNILFNWQNNAQGNDLGTALPAYGVMTIVKNSIATVMTLSEDEPVSNCEVYYIKLDQAVNGTKIYFGTTVKISFEVSRVEPGYGVSLDDILSLSILREPVEEESSMEESSKEESSQEESSKEESSKEESSKEESSQEESSKEESSKEESSIEDSSKEESSIIEESSQSESIPESESTNE